MTAQTAAVQRPPAGDLGLLVIAICAVSTSGPLIAAAAAPGLAIAFWRNGLAMGLLGPFAVLRSRVRREILALPRRHLAMAVVAGTLLACHFGTWVPSLSRTSVASATALVATQPVWNALIARAQGHVVPPRVWTGIAIAITGAVLLTGVDAGVVSARTLPGNALALVGAVFAAAYVAAGARVRRTMSTSAYTTVCYGTAACWLLLACVVSGQALTGYSLRTWLELVGIALGAQLVGHSLINRVLETTSPTAVALAILFEVPGAAILAAIFLGQRPPLMGIPALALLLLGIAVVVGVHPRRAVVEPAGLD